MKILAIGTSNNRESINMQLASHAARLMHGAEVEVLSISDYELPLFSDEREKQLGQPELAKSFYQKIGEADALVISYTEYNGSYTAAYKNLFDWTSRIDTKVFQDKPAVYLSTSPGPGGARSVLKSAVDSAEFFGADLVSNVSIPSFYENFDKENGFITNDILQKQLKDAIQLLYKRVKNIAEMSPVISI